MRVISIAMFAVAPIVAPSLSHAQCVVRGDGRLVGIRVAPVGAEPFILNLSSGHPVEITPHPASRADVAVVGGFRFRGTVDPVMQWYRVDRDLDQYGGMVHVDRRQTFTHAHFANDSALLDVHVLGGAVGIAVPCRSLGLGRDPVETLVPAERSETYAHATLSSTGAELALRPTAEGPVVVHLRAEGSPPLRVREITRTNDRVEIVAPGDGGTYVRGWVDVASVRAAAAAPPDDRIVDVTDESQCNEHVAVAYRGPAVLRVGAEIRARRDGPTWAHAAERLAVTIVRETSSADWIQIDRLAGVTRAGRCPSLSDIAWVRASDVEIASH